MNFEMVAAEPLQAQTYYSIVGQDRPNTISLSTDSNY
jgi:hypothetical protein